MARETRESSLDELAKGLASGTVSRGKALRWMGGALVGAAVASVPGGAWAVSSNEQSACVAFCNQVFPLGRRRRRCINQGARGRGPCYSCTPSVGPGPNFVPPKCSGGEFNPDTCGCDCPPNTQYHSLSDQCLPSVCQPEDAQRCADNPGEDSDLCCPRYTDSGEPSGFYCCSVQGTCNIDVPDPQSTCASS
jgi:hypothetical protein